jgi:hypothetical protein
MHGVFRVDGEGASSFASSVRTAASEVARHGQTMDAAVSSVAAAGASPELSGSLAQFAARYSSRGATLSSYLEEVGQSLSDVLTGVEQVDGQLGSAAEAR